MLVGALDKAVNDPAVAAMAEKAGMGLSLQSPEEVTADLRVHGANGQVTVGQAAGDVDASTGNGDIRVGGVTRGTAALKTGFGEIEIGLSAGTAARLDLYTHFGRVHNQLTATDGPEASDQVVEVRARTSHGDIVIHRS